MKYSFSLEKLFSQGEKLTYWIILIFLFTSAILLIYNGLSSWVKTADKPDHFEHFMNERGVLSVLMFVFVISIVLLHRNKQT